VIDPLKPVAPGVLPTPIAAPAAPAKGGVSFGDLLADRLDASAPKLNFSSHALDRIRQRGIPVDETRLGAGVDRAAAKGARTALVLMDQAAFVVAAQNRTVITAVDREHMREQVFTNIDSAVLA
jgi:flagellar operon protein